MRENKQILYMQASTTQKVHYRVYLKSLFSEIIFDLSVCKVLSVKYGMVWRDYSLFKPNQRNICLYIATFSCILELREAISRIYQTGFAWVFSIFATPHFAC